MTDDARTARLRVMDAADAYASICDEHMTVNSPQINAAMDKLDAAVDAYAAEMRREGARTEHDAMCFTCKPQLPGGCWIRCARWLALSEAERGEAP